MEQVDEATERKGFFGRLLSAFSRREEEEDKEETTPRYKRRLFDGRIEKYLDQNMSAYVSEYGIITGLDLEVYEERYNTLTARTQAMKEFMLDASAKVSGLENELLEVQTASGKK